MWAWQSVTAGYSWIQKPWPVSSLFTVDKRVTSDAVRGGSLLLAGYKYFWRFCALVISFYLPPPASWPRLGRSQDFKAHA